MSSPINMFTFKKNRTAEVGASHRKGGKLDKSRCCVSLHCGHVTATERSYELFLLLACVLSREAKTLDILHQQKIIYGNFQNTSLTFSSILPDDSNMQKKAFFLVKGFYLFT